MGSQPPPIVFPNPFLPLFSFSLSVVIPLHDFHHLLAPSFFVFQFVPWLDSALRELTQHKPNASKILSSALCCRWDYLSPTSRGLTHSVGPLEVDPYVGQYSLFSQPILTQTILANQHIDYPSHVASY